jgi:DNA polymerase-3 subunit delta
MIHFYYGEDDLGLHRQVDSIVAKFADKYGAENVTRIDAGETAADAILSETVNISLFAPNRLIILSGAFANRELANKLPDNLSRVPDETELVIVEPKPDKRTKLYKVLGKEYKPREFARPKNLLDFTLTEAASSRVEMGHEAADELIIYTNGDMWRIASEIAKFRALDRVVTVELVHELVEPDLSASAFNLLDDLLNGRRDKAMAELAKLRQVEDANKFLGLLSSQVFALAAAKNAGDRPSATVASEMGVHPFVMSKMFDVARKMSVRDVARIARIVAETDAKIKSMGVEPWILIELAINKV